MPLIVPGVCRYTVHANMANQEIANVLDFDIDSEATPRVDSVPALAGRILELWHETFRNQQVNNLTLTSISWVDLDTLDGQTGETSEGGPYTWPATGVSTGTPMPGGISVLIRKLTTGGRATRSGRMYVAGMTETQTDDAEPNELDTTALAGWQSAADGFLTGVNSGEVGYDAQMAVVHSTPDPNVGTFTEVSALQVDEVLATQRRRQR